MVTAVVSVSGEYLPADVRWQWLVTGSDRGSGVECTPPRAIGKVRIATLTQLADELGVESSIEGNNAVMGVDHVLATSWIGCE